MAKNQRRGNREAKKPKAPKKEGPQEEGGRDHLGRGDTAAEGQGARPLETPDKVALVICTKRQSPRGKTL